MPGLDPLGGRVAKPRTNVVSTLGGLRIVRDTQPFQIRNPFSMVWTEKQSASRTKEADRTAFEVR